MDTTEIINKLNSLHYSIIAAMIAAFAALIVAIINYRAQRKAIKVQEKLAALQTSLGENSLTKDKILDLQKQLEEFYKPFKAYLTESAFLYKVFRAGQPEQFRTLIYLIDNDYQFGDGEGQNLRRAKFSSNNEKLIDRILEIESKLYDLIVQKGGIVEDKILYDKYSPNANITDIFADFDPNMPEKLPTNISLISLFMVHYSLMKLAKDKQLDKEKIDVYKNFVYPRELNHRIDENIEKLSMEISSLKDQLKSIV